MDIKFYINKGEDIEFEEEEFPLVINDYNRMIDIFIYLIETMRDKKIKDDYWRYFSEILAIKFIWSANTLTNIVNGSTVQSEIMKFSTKIIDLPSIYTLLRAQIENYSTFQYLYIRPESKQIQEFRCLIYELSGLESRQQFDSSLPDTKAIKLEEEKRIVEVLTQLKSNSVFHSLEESEQRKILNDKKARLYGWRKIIEESDLIDNLYKNSWLLFSNFAHSEYNSLIHMRGYIQNPEETPTARNLAQNLAMVLICIYIKDFIELYPEYKERYNALGNNDKDVIEIFNGVGRKSVIIEK